MESQESRGRGLWVWDKLEAGRLAQRHLQRGRCKEESLDKSQGRADSKMGEMRQRGTLV